ncbi:hypothetical protein O3M35_009085 [Rhynocoris fuscipes]|uniref:Uncharacterized protein n=1 Tax=Rhynocoris fuscipes TaxID=488301 RepID=A0AAW1D711_9HEMI
MAFCAGHCGPQNAWRGAQGEEAGDRCSAWAVDDCGGLVRAGVQRNPHYWDSGSGFRERDHQENKSAQDLAPRLL